MAINVKDKLVTLESLGVAYSAEQDAREEADQALSTRIDNIVAPEGDPSLTEVSDARVSGSTTYNTLKARLDADKAAIGTEISQLSADLGDLDERVEALEGGGSGGSGLTDAVKTALMNLVNHLAWDDDDPTGQTYIDALEEALYPTVTTRTVSYSLSHVTSSNNASTVTSGASYTATLTASSGYTINTVTVTMGGADVTSTVYSSGTITIPSVTGNIVITATAVASVSSISAVYTQGGTVYETDTLDSLKSDLVVTATYTGGTTSTIPGTDYILSGTLAEGTSTITVSYGGKTTTFNVTVSFDIDGPIDVTDRTYVSGYINDQGAITSLSNNYVGNMYIPVTGHVIIDATSKASSVSSIRLAEYDANKTFIKRSYVTINNAGSAAGFVLDVSTAYIRVGFATTDAEGVFEAFSVYKNTAVSNYLYVESGSIDTSGTDTSAKNRVRSDYIELANGTSSFRILYTTLSDATAQLILYDASHAYISKEPSAGPSFYNRNTGTSGVYARLIYGIDGGSVSMSDVVDSVMVIDNVVYRLKERTES